MPVTFTGKAPEPPALRGRNFKPEKFEVYGRLNMTPHEIAGMERSSYRVIVKALTNPALREAYEFGRSEVVSMVRQKQITLALQGNVQMLMYAGKHFANQNDDDLGIPDSFVPDQFTWDSKSRERLEELRASFSDPIDGDYTDVTDQDADGDE